MKNYKLIISILTLLIIPFSQALATDIIPFEVKSNFEEVHGEDVSAKWKAFPNADNSEEVITHYYGTDHLNKFYTAEFNNENGKTIKKFYNDEGECILSVTKMQKEEIPQNIKTLLSEKRYKGWSLENYEMVTSDFEKNTPEYKISLSKDDRAHVLYLNDQWLLKDIMKWQDHTNKFRNQNRDTDYAFSSPQKIKEYINHLDVPARIASKINEENKYNNIVHWAKVDLNHTPDELYDFQYYDVTVNQLYEVTYKYKNKTYRDIFNENGQLLSTSKVVIWKKLPAKVKNLIHTNASENWNIEQYVDVSESEDGVMLYKINYMIFGDSNVLYLNFKS